MRAGPKGIIDAPPLDLAGYPTDRAERRMRFIEQHLITPRGHGANQPFNLRQFQRQIIHGSFAPECSSEQPITSPIRD